MFLVVLAICFESQGLNFLQPSLEGYEKLHLMLFEEKNSEWLTKNKRKMWPRVKSPEGKLFFSSRET